MFESCNRNQLLSIRQPLFKNLLVFTLVLVGTLIPQAVLAFKKISAGQSLVVMTRPHADVEKFKERLQKRGLSIANEIRCKKDAWSIFEVQPRSGSAQSALSSILSNPDVDLEGVKVKSAVKALQCVPSINDPDYANQANLQSLNYSEFICLMDAMNVQQSRQPTITFVDSGITPVSNEITNVTQFNFVSGAGGTLETAFDSGSHGTGVCSVACSSTNNSLLMAGVATKDLTARIVSCRISQNGSSIDEFDVYSALTWCVDNQNLRGGPGPINLSINNPVAPYFNDSPIIQGIAKSLAKQGDLIVNGAGNNNGEDPGKSHKGIVRIGGIDEMDNQWTVNSSFGSNYGKFIRAVAPASNVRLYLNSIPGLGNTSGTSLSAPAWSGAIALLMSLNAKLTAPKAYSLLYKTGVETPQGTVKPDLRAAVIKALKLKP